MGLSDVKKDPDPKTIYGLFIFLIFATAGVTGLLVFDHYTINKTNVRALKNELQFTKLKGEIIYQREVLSMSASMAVATGDQKWVKRYKEHAEYLNKAVSDISPFVAPRAADFIEQLNSLNKQLLDFEKNAFELLTQNKKNEAKKILLGEKYMKLKSLYSDLFKSSSSGYTSDVRLLVLKDRIITLDELLTMSARLAATTGDNYWEKNYRYYEKELDMVLAETKTIAPSLIFSDATKKTDEANNALIALENESFILGKQGKHDEAFKILISDEYENQKKIYKSGMDEFEVSTNEKIDTVFHEYSTDIYLRFLFFSISLVLLFSGWIFLARLFRIIRSTQKQIEQSAKLATLGELSAGVAHELNNPLQFIIGFNNSIRSALKKHGSVTESEIGEYVSEINMGAERMIRIIRNFRDFSRQTDHDLQEVSPNDMVLRSMELMSQHLKTRSVEVNLILSSDALTVKADRIRIEQVFINIISNASDALSEMRKGTPRTLIVSSWYQDGNVFIDFVDNGSGIAKSHLDKIFEPFFTTKKVGVGTGLGMSISYNIIKEHQGEIRVESTVQKGTKFTVVMPAKKVEHVSAKAA